MASSFELVITKLLRARDAIKVDSAQAQGFMFRLGARITEAAKREVVRQRVVDSGRLLSSLGFQVQTQGAQINLTVGTAGIRYGRMQEFGGTYSPAQMRAMFASFRERGLGGRPGKHVMVGTRLPPRPYLGPAFTAMTQTIGADLRAFFRSTMT